MINKKEQERLRNIKARFVLVDPFFANLLNKLVIFPTSEIKTAATDGQFLAYNPDFFDELSVPEQVFVFAHEVMHCAMLHHLRIGSREKETWNTAADYVVNGILVSNHSLVKGALFDSRFHGMSAEEVYELLLQEEDKAEQNGSSGSNAESGSGGGGAPDDLYSPGTLPVPEELRNSVGEKNESEQEIEWRSTVESLRQSLGGTLAGTRAGHFLREFDKVFNPSVDYRKILNQFLTTCLSKTTSWKKTKKRLRAHGIVLPGKARQKEALDVAVIVDTSGSISRDMISQINRDLEEIRAKFEATIHFITVDSAVHDYFVVKPHDKIELTYRGGGGTSFVPGFNLLQRERVLPKVCLYYTDGYCNTFPQSVPRFPVLWMLTIRNNWFKPPFGKIIKMV